MDLRTILARWLGNSHTGTGPQNNGPSVTIYNYYPKPNAGGPSSQELQSTHKEIPFYQTKRFRAALIFVLILAAILVPVGFYRIRPLLHHGPSSISSSSSSPSPTLSLNLASSPISTYTVTETSDPAAISSGSQASPTSTSSTGIQTKSLQSTSQSSIGTTTPSPQTFPKSPASTTASDHETLVAQSSITAAPTCVYNCIDPSACSWGCPGATCSNLNDCADPYPCNTVAHTCCNKDVCQDGPARTRACRH